MDNKSGLDNMFDSDVVGVIRNYMLKYKQTISAAESVTAGFLQAALSSAVDASLFFQGGITAYNLGQKYRHLVVEPIHALSCNCVSDKVAGEMALNVCNLFHSDWGIGITGYAAPVPESDNKVFAHWAIASQNNIILAEEITASQDTPVAVQIEYVNHLLRQFAGYLKNNV